MEEIEQFDEGKDHNPRTEWKYETRAQKIKLGGVLLTYKSQEEERVTLEGKPGKVEDMVRALTTAVRTRRETSPINENGKEESSASQPQPAHGRKRGGRSWVKTERETELWKQWETIAKRDEGIGQNEYNAGQYVDKKGPIKKSKRKENTPNRKGEAKEKGTPKEKRTQL